MDDGDWLALCVYKEAAGECADGRAAVARVVMNRTAARYSSSGTIWSTVTWPSQFSWCEFDWAQVVDPKTGQVSHRYVRVVTGAAQVRARAQAMLTGAEVKDIAVLAACRSIADAVRSRSYPGGAGYRALTPDTVLYANLALCSPAWALKLPRVTTIGHQAFYRDPRADPSTPAEAIAPHQLAPAAGFIPVKL